MTSDRMQRCLKIRKKLKNRTAKKLTCLYTEDHDQKRNTKK
jgi:hypothetical protein